MGNVQDFDNPVGKGVTGIVDRKRLIVGSPRIMGEAQIDVSPLTAKAEELRNEGATVVFIAIDGTVAGLFAISEPIKETTFEAVKALVEAGVQVVMLTGDNKATAAAVARKLGITKVEAEVLPEDKSRIVIRLRKEGRIVDSDGVNDAPALAAADVGIAMGTGTDVAIESAGVTLLKGDLHGIVRLVRLAAQQ